MQSELCFLRDRNEFIAYNTSANLYVELYLIMIFQENNPNIDYFELNLSFIWILKRFLAQKSIEMRNIQQLLQSKRP